MKRPRKPEIICVLILSVATAALMYFPKEVSQAVRDGLQLCANTLFPNLFPFFVLSSLFVKFGLAQVLGAFSEPLMRPLFHLPGSCAPAWILGMIGGYPSGAKTAVSLYREGLCSRQETERLLSFCNNCGPAFLLGVTGSGMFGNLQCGFMLMGVHFTAALLTGMILNRCAPTSRPQRQSKPHTYPRSFSVSFVNSVKESIQALLDLSAFVLCFCAITRLIALSALPHLLATCALPFLSQPNGESLLLGLLELTQGVTQLRAGSTQERLILTSALLGWGGLSVHCQVLALLQDTDLSPVLYFKGKALHGILSAVLTAAALWNLNGLCLLCGGALLLWPCSTAKKRSGKSAQGVV